MSIYTAPYRRPNYIHLNQRESNILNPHKQQGVRRIGTGYCNVCSRETHYQNQELCAGCRNRLIEGTLLEQYTGILRIYDDEHKKYLPLVTDYLVSQIDYAMNHKFKTRTYKNKTAKLIYIMKKYLEANGDIEPDVCYRRLRYYALTSKRDSLQMTLTSGKKLFNILFSYLYKNVNH